MTNARKRGLVAGVATCVALMVALTVTCDAALFGLLRSRRSSSRPVPVVKQSLMIFPFDRDADSAIAIGENFGQGIGEYLLSTLSVSKGYSVILFHERLSSVRRAREDNVIKDADIKGPFFTDKAKADKLAELLGVDYYIIGSVETYTYDKDKKTAELTLKADLVAAKTGKVSQEFLVGGSAAEGAQPMDEEELQSIAAGKAVEALTQKVLATSAADSIPVPPPTETKDKK